MALMALLVSVACLATPVQGREVKAGPFTGIVDPQYDVVDGRFHLHVGAWRDRAAGVSQKIAWAVPASYRVTGWLTVTGLRLRPAPRRYVDRFPEAYLPDPNDYGWTFSANMSPPAAGCWRLTLSSGQARGTLTVLVRG